MFLLNEEENSFHNCSSLDCSTSLNAGKAKWNVTTINLFFHWHYYNVIPFNTAVRIRPMMKCVKYLCDVLYNIWLGVCKHIQY